MNNSVVPYTVSDSSEDSEDNSSDDSLSDEGMPLSSNVGVFNQPINQPIDTQMGKAFLNAEKINQYQEKRNKLFTPELSKHRLVIESKSIEHTSSHSTSNYVINFNDESSTNHNGYYNYDNVIGFKFIKAILPNSIYQINDNNKSFQLQIESGSPITVTLDNGAYNFTEMGTHLLSKLTAIDGLFTLTSDSTTYKYNITHIGTKVRFLWKSSTGYAYRLFGFMNIDTEYKLSHTSDQVVQHNSHFVDLIIPEIPYIACKHNNTGKTLIERIPLGKSGEINEYINDYNLDNYFYPIKLSKLTIQLYEDSTDMFYKCQNADNSFEFEITILNS
mgnify:FL=1